MFKPSEKLFFNIVIVKYIVGIVQKKIVVDLHDSRYEYYSRIQNWRLQIVIKLN